MNRKAMIRGGVTLPHTVKSCRERRQRETKLVWLGGRQEYCKVSQR